MQHTSGEIYNTLLEVDNYFGKKLHLRCLTEFKITLIVWKVACHSVIAGFNQDGWCCPPNYQVSTKVYWYPDCLTVSNVTHCDDEFCLFDMSNDVEERRDLSKQHPDILEKMLQRLSEYEATMVPARNIRIKDLRASPKFHNGVFEPWAKEY